MHFLCLVQLPGTWAGRVERKLVRCDMFVFGVVRSKRSM
jgi:hypothetical protein